MSNTSEIISQLDILNRDNFIPIYVPSLKKEVRFKSLNLKQQKNLLKSSIDETLTKLSFIINFHGILSENVLDSIDINDFYTFDRQAIAIALRAKCLDATYKFEDRDLNLNDLVTTFPQANYDFAFEKDIIFNNFCVSLQAPKLGFEKEMSQFSLNKLRTTADKDFKSVIGELFVYELIKFVKTIKITKEDKTFEYSTQNQRIDDIVQIVEKLPSQINNQILDYIKSYRDIEKYYAFLDNVAIEVDGAFFTI